MADCFKSACEIFVAETGKTLNPASTPSAPEINSEKLDHLLNTPGKFSSKAASFTMNLMYSARMAMPQICMIVSRLASQITKSSADSDRRLLRVYGYLRANADKVLTGTPSKSDRKHLKIIAWPGADLNGDFMSTESTDGFFVELAGREGRGSPLAWGSHKQGSTAMHTAEAETVSLAHCCRQQLIPLQILLQALLGEAVDCIVKEDNAACIIAVTKGSSPSLRHLKRTQRIALGHLHEIFFDEDEHHDGSATTDGKFTLEKAATADSPTTRATSSRRSFILRSSTTRWTSSGADARRLRLPPNRRSRTGRTSRCSDAPESSCVHLHQAAQMGEQRGQPGDGEEEEEGEPRDRHPGDHDEGSPRDRHRELPDRGGQEDHGQERSAAPAA